MFYSSYDKQCGRYMSSGGNSKTREECIAEVYDYLISDDEDDVPDLTKNTKEDWVLQNEFEIEEHEEEIEETVY